VTIECNGRSVSALSKDERDRLERNIALAINHHTTTRSPVVPLRVERTGSGWFGSALEHFEGSANIRRQFERNLHQQTAPGVGCNILIGAVLPNNSIFAGEGVPAQWPFRIASLIARARSLVAKGKLDREEAMKLFRNADIDAEI
jgi:hypothetical protein